MINDEFIKTAKLNEQQKELYETIKFNPTKEQYYKLFPASAIMKGPSRTINTGIGAAIMGVKAGNDRISQGGVLASVLGHTAGGAVLGAGAGYLGSTISEMAERGINKMRINNRYKKAIKLIPEDELNRIMSLPESEQKKSLIKYVKKL